MNKLSIKQFAKIGIVLFFFCVGSVHAQGIQSQLMQLKQLETETGTDQQSNQPDTGQITQFGNTQGNAAVPAASQSSSSPAQSGYTSGASLKDNAFASTANSMLPISPDQIRVLRHLYDQTQQAASQPSGIPPRPTTTSVAVDLSPGATPSIIRLSSGYITSLVFLDATGAPWPITSVDLGDPKSYNLQWDQKSVTSTLLVQAITQYKAANIAVMLKGLKTPVMLTLLPGQQAVDYRVDLRVSGIGPNSTQTQSSLPSTESPKLLDVLNGIPPSGAQVLKIYGGDAKGWLVGNNLFLRTRLTVLSPGWISKMSSADGTNAYELNKTSLVLASSQGKTVKLTIEGF